MTLREDIDGIVQELLQEDLTLRGKERELTQIIGRLIAEDPFEAPNPAFLVNLREELRAKAVTTPVLGRSWWKIGGLFTTFASAAVALLVLFLSGQRPDSPSIAPSPESPTMQMESYGETDNANDVDLRQMKSVPENSAEETGPAGGGLPPAEPAMQDATAPAPAEPTMMQMKMQMAIPVELPEGLTLPIDLPTEAKMIDQRDGTQKIINLRPVTVMDEVKDIVRNAAQKRLTDETIESIALGDPHQEVASYWFEGLPGTVDVPVWMFGLVTINGKIRQEFTRLPIIVPIILPAYE